MNDINAPIRSTGHEIGGFTHSVTLGHQVSGFTPRVGESSSPIAPHQHQHLHSADSGCCDHQQTASAVSRCSLATFAGGTFRKISFNKNRGEEGRETAHEALDRAYTRLSQKIEQVCGQGTKFLAFLGTKRCILTSVDGTRQEMSAGELKKLLAGTVPLDAEADLAGIHRGKIAQHRYPEAVAEHIVSDYFRVFEEAAKASGLTVVSHYSAKGADRRESQRGPVPMQLNSTSPLSLLNKQVATFQDAVKGGISNEAIPRSRLGRGAKYPSALGVIGRIDDQEKQREAATKILLTELMTAKFRRKVEEKATDLQNQIGTALPEHRDELTKKMMAYRAIATDVQALHRHALYETVLHSEEGAESCYNALLQALYSEYCAALPADQSPISLAQFSQPASPYAEYAGDVASTMLASPADYRRFCAEHQLTPKAGHANVFALHLLNGGEVNLALLPNCSMSPELQLELQTELEALPEECKKECELILEEVENKWNSLVVSDPEERLKIALKNPAVTALL